MNLFTQNAKMKKSSNGRYRVYNWTLPAYQANDEFVTCPFAGECATGCYAQQGAYRWTNVSKKHHQNLTLTKAPNFRRKIHMEINELQIKAKRAGKQLVIRIHDSGDFYSLRYLEDWLITMDRLPDVIFYAYTKAIPLFRSIIHSRDIPSNFTVIYSEGGKFDRMIDRSRHRHSRVFSSIDELKKSGYVDTTENDLNAIGVNKKIGLVYHGAKSKLWTTNK